MSAPDPAAALANYLKHTTVSARVHGIYRPKLPAEAQLPTPMPAAYLVLRRSGGYALFGGGPIPLGDPRIEFDCYGETEIDADGVAGEVINALRALRQSVWPESSQVGARKVRLLWARIESGPVPLIDPDTDWPSARLSVQLAHTEVSL